MTSELAFQKRVVYSGVITHATLLDRNNLRERTSKSLHFYRFPGKAYETQRRQAWITAVCRQNEDGSKWSPSPATRICSAHFVDNCKNDAEAHPSYIPTIFPPVYKKKAPNVERAKRMLKRSSRCQPMPPPVGVPPDPDTVSEPEATTEAESSNWDSSTTLVHTAAQAMPTKCTSTVATQTDDEALDGGPLWLLLSATDGLNGSTQVTHIEQVDEPGDVVLSDKGFPSIRTTVAEKGAVLVMPPFSSAGQQ
ncbi:hypothetical protein HPB47_014953, partial [Ixodes persulcatus]